MFIEDGSNRLGNAGESDVAKLADMLGVNLVGFGVNITDGV